MIQNIAQWLASYNVFIVYVSSLKAMCDISNKQKATTRQYCYCLVGCFLDRIIIKTHYRAKFLMYS